MKLPDLICFSHLRWNFVFQRPQHLMTRFARERRVFFVEEPILTDDEPRLIVTRCDSGVWVVAPHLPATWSETRMIVGQRLLLEAFARERGIEAPVLWFYTPMSLPLRPSGPHAAVVYDCMDELSLFAGAPPLLREREAQLLTLADLVTTGGHSLYEYKRDSHPNVHPFPSSVDVPHFIKARAIGRNGDPADQASIPHPRLGFFGVIDERLDTELVQEVAQRRPDWSIVLLGPVVKIDPERLPRLSNVHYLGMKSYADLPAYLAGWDVALLPFARNDATRFISPTKTPEYLAAGKPVVSTSIRDVVRPYGELGLVKIADAPEGFVRAVEECLTEDATRRQAEADAFLAAMSWDETWRRMKCLLDEAVRRNASATEIDEYGGDTAGL